MRRANRDCVILGLLDRSADCVEVLDRGADDFLEKPCRVREVVAKVRSLLRLLGRNERGPVLDFGDLAIDVAARQVRVGDRLVPMPAKEFDLLAFLAASPDRVFSRKELLERVWHVQDDWLGADTVTEHVRRLRRRIDSDQVIPRITTLRGAGYRFDP